MLSVFTGQLTCNTEVQPSLHYRGVHCAHVSAKDARNDKRRTYLRKASIDKQVQETSKDFVTHEYREVEISDGKGTSVSPGIRPVVRSCQPEADHVK